MFTLQVIKDESSPAEHIVCIIEQQALLQKFLQQIAEAQASGRLGYVSLLIALSLSLSLSPLSLMHTLNCLLHLVI